MLPVTASFAEIQLSRSEACRLLEHFYESPNQEFHTRLIRRYRLLDRRAPRPTSPPLLLSILCESWNVIAVEIRLTATRLCYVYATP